MFWVRLVKFLLKAISQAQANKFEFFIFHYVTGVCKSLSRSVLGLECVHFIALHKFQTIISLFKRIDRYADMST
jgi:hypothetical protein